jgi:DinB superfamily
MNEKIEIQLRRLDADLESLLKALLRYPQERLAQKPGPGQWSPYEVMQHLMIAENGAFRYISKKTLDPSKLVSSNLASRFRGWLIKTYLTTPFKFKAPPAAADDVFQPVESFAQISGQWQQQRAELRKLLESLPETVFHAQAYKHPVGGRIDIASMLDFFAAHFQRHRKQIERALQGA